MNNNEFGKLPPQAIEVEEAVIGACLLENHAFDNVAGIITPESFYKDQHKKIFNCITEMKAKGVQVDMLTVTDYLLTKGLLQEVGGPVYISQLTAKVASAAHIQHHALIIRQKHVQRCIINNTSELQNAAYDDDFDELMKLYSIVTSQIDDLLAGKSSMRHVREIAQSSLTELENRAKKTKAGGMAGIPTGLSKLDSLTSGWQGGNLIILAARPAMGKTAIALNAFTKTAAMSGNNVCFFSLEMTDVSLFDRLALSWGGVSKKSFKAGNLKDAEYNAYNRALSELSRLPIWIDDNHSTNMNYIRSVTRSKVRKGECQMVVIDYLQLVESSGDSKFMNREREVAIISRSLKSMAKELNIPVILLAQLNRGVENRSGLEGKCPQLSDLRESGSIEQDADMVIMAWRPDYYGYTADAEGNDLTNVVLLELKKNRDGETGSVIAHRNNEFTQISNPGYNDDNPF